MNRDSSEQFIRERNEWLHTGLVNGYVTPPMCYTHEGLPTLPEEDAELDAGYDPCLTILRLCEPFEFSEVLAHQKMKAWEEWRE